MQIKMRKAAAGPEFSYAEGAIVDVSAARGRALIACGSAEPVVPPPAVEEAIAPAPEAATGAGAKPRRKKATKRTKRS